MPVFQTLKGKIVRGGLYLTLRQLVSVVLSLISVLVIARILGPENYGIVASALGIFYFLVWTVPLGLNIYLVRQPDLSPTVPKQVLAFFNLVGLAVALVLWLAAPAIGGWTGRSEITEIVRWLPLPIWTELVAIVSISLLERELQFAQVGLIETLAQIANYLTAVTLVLLHWSYWGPIAGLIVRGVVLLGLARYFHPVGWGWQWQWQTLKPALRYGLTFSISDWILAARALTIPLVVSRIATLEIAGLISIAIRLVDQLAILRLVIRRMSISIMAKLIDDADAVRHAIDRGMSYQVLLVGSLCAIFACFDAWIVPQLFGEDWLLSTQIFPAIALATLVRAMFDLHASALYAAGQNRSVARSNLAYLGLLWLGCWLFLPRFGLWGYGFAELLTIPGYWLLHQSVTQKFGSPHYGVAFSLVLATALSLFLSTVVSPLVSFAVLIVSYAGLFLSIPRVRAIPQDLLTALRS